MKLWLPILAAVSWSPSQACTVGFGDVARAAEEAVCAFAGQVIQAHTPRESRRANNFAVVVVGEVWLGSVPDTVVVGSHLSSCGVQFQEGMDYVFLPNFSQEPPESGEEYFGLDPDDAGLSHPMLEVWVGSCEQYARGGLDCYLTLGVPEVRAVWQDRPTALDEAIAILETGEPPAVRKLLEFLRRELWYMPDDEKERYFSSTFVFAELAGTLVVLAERSLGHDPELHALAYSTLGRSRRLSRQALPQLLKILPTKLKGDRDPAYWKLMEGIGSWHPGVSRAIAE